VTGLHRKLGLFSTTNLVIANMIGAGVFTTSGLLMVELGDPLLMIGLWLAGGLLALCGALCYGELGAAMPRAGGEYVYLGELFHPVLGFLAGWVSFLVGFTAPLAVSAIGCSEYLAAAFPVLIASGDPLILKKSMAIILIGALTAVHLRGIETGARLQNYLTVGKVVLILALILAGVAVGRGDLGHLLQGAAINEPSLAGVGPPGAGLEVQGASWRSSGLALMWIMFAYSGWNASGYIGSEIRSPERNLPLSLFLGTGTVLLLYLGLNVFFVYAVPPEEMKGVIAIGGLAAERMLGGSAEVIFSGLIAFALLSSISALIILGPRVYFAMARDGYFFQSLGRVHPTTRVPGRSIVLQSLIAIILVVSGTFDQILTYMGFCLGIFPILAVLGLFKLRRSGGGGYRMPGYPLVPALFATTGVLMLTLAYLERPKESTVALLTVAAGIPFFFLFSRRRQKGLAGVGTPVE
jgi:APA family basic amino acid/polyamine antiporter